MKMTAVASVFLLVLVALPSVAPYYQFSSNSEVLRTSTDGRIRGARDRAGKDFVLGGLFPIHTATEGGGVCGEVRLERGLERMEAMLFAIDMINNDTSLLPGLTLGYDIRDTCNSENIGLDETVDLIITSSQLDIVSCPSVTMGTNGTDDVAMDAPTMGIVGAAASRVSVPVASLVRLFTTPQVSYASSSAILSNRDRYEYFYRTISPDNLQARAMVDLMLHLGWSYASTIFSRNPYGEPGIIEFKNLAATNGICIDVDEGIEDNFSEEDFARLAQQLIDSQANIVVLFTSQDNARHLLSQVAEKTTTRRFIWIASDAWARSINLVHMFNTTTAGLYGFVPLTEHLSTFQDYFSQLTVDSNVRNPWFQEFYEAIANCTVDGEDEREVCNRSLSVAEIPRYKQGNFIPLVVDAVYTYAHALQDFLDENCQQPLVWFPNNRTCLNQSRTLTGAALLEYIQEVDFQSPTDNRVLFDTEGNVEGRYEILNYQASDSSGRREYSFERVAIWDSSVSYDTQQQALLVEPEAVFQFGVRNMTDDILYIPPESQCGRCPPGYFRQVVQSACCGLCEPCLGEFFSNDSTATTCQECEGETWGNNPLVGSERCVQIKESFLEADHPYSIIIMIIAILGLGGVVFVVVVFAVFWKTPVVKSSGREQMVLLLIGITISFISSFFYVAPPIPVVCGFQRWILWTSFSIMFGALLVKIIRVARIFLRKKNVTRPRFTEPAYQVFFTFVFIFTQWLILAISFAVQHPEVDREMRKNSDEPNKFPEVIVTCIVDHIALLSLSIVYETALIIACTILGALSFSYPENFNEAKYVAFCSLSILVIWIAFIITYIATREVQEFQNIAISLAVVMTGYAVLFCLFGPKLLIVLFQPDKNVKKFSHHTTDVNSVPLGSLVGAGDGLQGSVKRLSTAQPFVPSRSATPIMERKQKGTNGPSPLANTQVIATSKADSRVNGNLAPPDSSLPIIEVSTPMGVTSNGTHSFPNSDNKEVEENSTC